MAKQTAAHVAQTHDEADGAGVATDMRGASSGVHKGMYNPPRGSKIPEWRITHFLEVLTETSNVQEAVRQSGIPSSTIYGRRARDPDFARRFNHALESGIMDIRVKAIEQGRFGETTVETIAETPDGKRQKTVVHDSALKALIAIDRLHGGSLAQHTAQKTQEDYRMERRAEKVVLDAMVLVLTKYLNERHAEQEAKAAAEAALAAETAADGAVQDGDGAGDDTGDGTGDDMTGVSIH